ncbi:ThiF family adenylyltransferase [Bradyrhizobium sp. LHD-71]|uniref:shikimate dehydrogenase family protein n=1 Tax=Bradyrhizobium sp. LHD-71 TaxID=3072141 RepID=UPI00280EC35F|nr:ThiF family adenylyltransferase [Bradyrhizobium sp. LHD-71]MDQ8729832.1 ThiF family adenylyltransferase [Bradyrhizobium sp. LHD-71]
MLELNLTGATRLNFILGDPIAQVKSPAGVTKAFFDRGHDGLLVPVQVGTDDLGSLLSVADRLKNLDGIVVTVPHKFACFEHCGSASERACFLGAVSIMRRRKDRGWHGDMLDGLGFVGAVRSKGYDPRGKRALLVGAGGAGSAIAMALVEAGVRELAIHDADTSRRDDLIGRLKTLGRSNIIVGTSDPSGYDLVGNATPAGMKASDPLPIDVTKLAPTAFVGCVITAPSIPPLIEAARRLGCLTTTGTEMYNAVQDSMLDFLLPDTS